MLESCLQQDPAQRPTAERLRHHEFFQKAPGKEYIMTKFLGEVSKEPRDDDFPLNLPVHDHIPDPLNHNVPVETLLGETEKHYIVFIRAIPKTSITLTLDSHELTIEGDIPPLKVEIGHTITTLENLNTKFVSKVKFPHQVSLNKQLSGYDKKMSKSTSTLKLEIPKFEPASTLPVTF